MEHNGMEAVDKCPICGSKDFSNFIVTCDHLISKSEFHIDRCMHCGFLFTNPRPDKDAIAKYYHSEDYVSHSDSKTGLINYVYRMVRHYTLKKKYLLIRSLSKGNSIIDYGCGTGHFLNVFKTKKWSVAGYEPERIARQYAIDKFSLPVTGNPADLKSMVSKVNVICMWHVLEHIHDFKSAVRDLMSLLSENGLLLIAVPNCNSYDAGKYGAHWAAYDLPRHLYHFRKKDMETFAGEIGCDIIKIAGMKFDSFYVSMLSEKNKNGKNNLLSAFYNGLLSNIKAAKTGEYSSLIYILKKT